MAGFINTRLKCEILEEITQYGTDNVCYYKVNLHYIDKTRIGLAKKLKNSDIQTDVNNFEKERALHRDLQHKNILAFIGDLFPPEDKDYTIVTEFPNGGTLNNFLCNRSDRLPDRQILSFALQLSTAIKYIQSKDILHQNITSNNFFLVESRRGNIVLKLSEFGCAKVSIHTTNVYLTEDSQRSRFRWQSPEALIENKISKKSDVYSLHIVFWELLARKKPYERQRNAVALMRFLRVGDTNRPEIPEHCPAEFRELITRGWVTNPEARPTITEVTQNLEQMNRR